MPSYTARELERESGFDRRTIAYYVQEGLLPKVGRRGPRTRYPQLFLDRLLFIRRVREAEEQGTVPPQSLRDLRDAFERMPPLIIARIAAETIAVTPELVSSPTTAFRLPEMGVRDAVEGLSGRAAHLRRRAGARLERMKSSLLEMEEPAAMEAPAFPMEMEPGDADDVAAAPVPQPEDPYDDVPEEDEYDARFLAKLLAEAERIGRRRRGTSRSAVEDWSRTRVSPNIEIAVRGLAEEERSLMDSVRHVMRRLIQRADTVRSFDPESDEERRE